VTGGDLDAAVTALLRRAAVVADQVGDRFPLYADPVSGGWVSTRRGSWTGGFWSGWWWLRAAVTGLSADRNTALEWTHRLVPRAGDDTVTRGMTFWYGAGVGHRLCGDVAARRVALDGAVALAAGFDGGLGLIPVGTAFGADATPRAAVDALAGTVSLLGWTADAGRYELERLARCHTGRHMLLLVDDHGRVRPKVTLRPDGTAVEEDGPPEVWARGQAWGVLGLSVAARRWGGGYADVARRVAQWWLDNMGTRVPAAVLGRSGAPVDTSAAAIAAAGLITLSSVTGDGFDEAAREIVAALVVDHLDTDGVLRNGCYDLAGGVATRHELVWGSYFLGAVLTVLTGRVERHPW
jgi:unsaturated chondroitin disaccharide hydrolase